MKNLEQLCKSIDHNFYRGWVITNDLIDGCSIATEDQLKALTAAGYVKQFRMFDGDGILYYEGLARFEETPFEEFNEFEPLDDYGMPNAGCTEIKYLNKSGHWGATHQTD